MFNIVVTNNNNTRFTISRGEATSAFACFHVDPGQIGIKRCLIMVCKPSLTTV